MVEMMHEEWFDLVSAAADGELDAFDEVRLAAHVAECGSCAALLDDFEARRRRARMHAGPGPSLTPPDTLVDAVLAARGEDRSRRSHARATLARRAGFAVVAMAAAILGVVSLSTTSPPAPATRSSDDVLIAATDHSFNHARVEVEAGATVEWTNDGSTMHHLVRRLGGATVGDDLAPGQTETATFAEPGTYEYFCTIHPEMTGTVTVDA